MAPPQHAADFPALLDGTIRYFRVRRIKGGPWVGCEITIADRLVRLSEDGNPATDAVSLDELDDLLVAWAMGEQQHPLVRTLLFGEAISAAQHRHLLTVAAWARVNAPNHPAANPDRPVDLNKLPIGMIF